MKARKAWSPLRRQRFEARRDQIRAWQMTAHIMFWTEHAARHLEQARTESRFAPGAKNYCKHEDDHETHKKMHFEDLRKACPFL